MNVMVTPWCLAIFMIPLNRAASETISMLEEEEFIADYLDTFVNLHPTFLVRTDMPGFGEFVMIPNVTLYSIIYYVEKDIEAVAERLASIVIRKDDLYDHNAVFFIGTGHYDIIQVVVIAIPYEDSVTDID